MTTNEGTDRPTPPGLAPFWDGPVSTFATLPPISITPAEQERHRIFAMCLMALMSNYWNGNKYGEQGNYGAWRAEQRIATLDEQTGIYAGGSYLGHNIAALAVDSSGRILDYEFNHNNIFDSSVEHAESRLVRRLFALSQVYTDWESAAQQTRFPSATAHASTPHPRPLGRFAQSASAEKESSSSEIDKSYATLLNDVTIYTSLESCAQCSGIMTLASVKNICYLQWDQGEFLIGNLMFNATHASPSGFTAPRPIPAGEFGLAHFDQLNAGSAAFDAKVSTSNPFYTDGSYTASSPSVTSYLCTDSARDIYQNAANGFRALPGGLQYPHQPPEGPPGSLDNAAALFAASHFLDYAIAIGNRGTSHRS